MDRKRAHPFLTLINTASPASPSMTPSHTIPAHGYADAQHRPNRTDSRRPPRRGLFALSYASPRRIGLINDAAVVSSLPRYELEKIAAPTLTISVADDLYGTFDGARYTADHIPHARFIGYPSGGHMLVGNNVEATARIAAFLKESAGF